MDCLHVPRCTLYRFYAATYLIQSNQTKRYNSNQSSFNPHRVRALYCICAKEYFRTCTFTRFVCKITIIRFAYSLNKVLFMCVLFIIMFFFCCVWCHVNVWVTRHITHVLAINYAFAVHIVCVCVGWVHKMYAQEKSCTKKKSGNHWGGCSTMFAAVDWHCHSPRHLMWDIHTHCVCVDSSILTNANTFVRTPTECTCTASDESILVRVTVLCTVHILLSLRSFCTNQFFVWYMARYNLERLDTKWEKHTVAEVMIGGVHWPINAVFIVCIIENMITCIAYARLVCVFSIFARNPLANVSLWWVLRLEKERKFMACDSQLVVSWRSFWK